MDIEQAEEIIEEELHVSWYIIAYKFIVGFFEVLLGLGITFFGHSAYVWYQAYATQELSEDPHAVLVRMTKGFVPNTLTHHSFLVVYLILLGAVKMLGAVGMMRHQYWGVDLLVAVTVIILPFQAVQLVLHPSIIDFLYILLGIGISLYLVNFQPHAWFKKQARKIKKRVGNKKVSGTN